MNTVIDLTFIAAWLTLGALLAYHVFETWRRVEPPPFFQVLKRQGLSLRQAEEAAGPEAIAGALRRCERCADRKACTRALAVDWLGHGLVACSPNAQFFRQVQGARAQRP